MIGCVSWSALGQPKIDGSDRTKRQHLERVYRITSKRPRDLELPELPESVQYIWQWFLELQTGEAITDLEIDAWARLNSIERMPRELQALMALERLRR